MDFLPYTMKWLELVLRWGHVLFAILWVGNSFLFNYLDNKLNKSISSSTIDGESYLMHSGYFYKLTRLKKSPSVNYLKSLVIFKWQSYLTFVTGILLLFVIYYYNSEILMVNKKVLESLILCGACDDLLEHRSEMFSSIDIIINFIKTLMS